MASHNLPCRQLTVTSQHLHITVSQRTVIFQHMNAGRVSSCPTATTAPGMLPCLAAGCGSDYMPRHSGHAGASMAICQAMSGPCMGSA